jgi:peptidoglycan-N-acetylglucosamine deacetylase
MAKKPKASRKGARRAVTPVFRTGVRRQVWLTFDDGPHPTRTAKVLDTLSAHGITACFFLIGKNAELYPALVQRIVREGHRIGNHTYGHPQLTNLTAAKVRQEITRTQTILGSALQSPKLFRPPYGAHNATVDSVVAALNYRSILWNVDTVDWNKAFQPDKWVAHGLAQIRARTSSVVLNHDIQASTANHLDAFIRKIKRLGNVRFMPASSL